jgi:hypothetical protein
LALYTPLYMSPKPKVRTQIYVTADQRRRLDEIARREDKAMAEVIRGAIDAFLSGAGEDPSRALDATFGVTPDLAVPSRDEWDHRA